MIHSRSDLLSSIENTFDDFANTLEIQPPELFEKGFDGKWTNGQQLDHLIRSTVPLNIALTIPKIFLRFFGLPDRSSRNYEQLIQRYQDKITSGGTATGRYIPKTVTLGSKKGLIKRFKKEGEKLYSNILPWSEEELDGYLLPHPLLGKVTIREMLFFTIYHTRHHLNSLYSGD